MNGIKIFNTQKIQQPYFGIKSKQEKQQANMLKKETADSFEKELKEKVAIITGITALALGAILLIKHSKSEKVRKTAADLSLQEFKQNECFKDGIARLKDKSAAETIAINGKEDKEKITETSIKESNKINTYNQKESSHKPNKRKIANKTAVDLSLQEFKQNGGFKDGIANFKDKLFTGTITINGEKNNATTLTYNKGKITKSLIKNPDKINTYDLKEYSYKRDGRKIIIQKEMWEFENHISPYSSPTSRTVIFPDKSNLYFTDSGKKGTVFINGKPKSVKIEYERNVDRYGLELPMSGPYKLVAIDSKTGVELPQNEGELVIDKLIELSDMKNNSPYYEISDAAFQ